jgi:hypothetical protein
MYSMPAMAPQEANFVWYLHEFRQPPQMMV